MDKLILYTTHCPRCNVLEKKMSKKNIVYAEIDSFEELNNKGIDAVPVLEINGKRLSYKEANDYINNL